MAVPVLVIGASGAGKSSSMRNFTPADVGVFNVASKPLPFKGKLPTINRANYDAIYSALRKPTKKCYVIDDVQFILAFEFFDRAKETGYGKFTDIAQKFYKLVQFIINEVPDDVTVYFLHHTEEAADGTLKAKTIGKMLDEKLTVEGMFSVVLLARAEKDRYFFVTQSEGYSTAKSPAGMFPAEIDNDLRYVDDTVREYWDMPPRVAEKKETKTKTEKKESAE